MTRPDTPAAPKVDRASPPVRQRLLVPIDHPAFEGHFPGRPLLPGVVLLAEALEAVLGAPALAERLGPAPRVAQVKFLAPVLPGDALEIRLDEAGGGGVRFELRAVTADDGSPADGRHPPSAVDGPSAAGLRPPTPVDDRSAKLVATGQFEAGA